MTFRNKFRNSGMRMKKSSLPEYMNEYMNEWKQSVWLHI